VPNTAEEELTKNSDSTSAHKAFASLESSLEIFSTNKTFKVRDKLFIFFSKLEKVVLYFPNCVIPIAKINVITI